MDRPTQGRPKWFSPTGCVSPVNLPCFPAASRKAPGPVRRVSERLDHARKAVRSRHRGASAASCRFNPSNELRAVPLSSGARSPLARSHSHASFPRGLWLPLSTFRGPADGCCPSRILPNQENHHVHLPGAAERHREHPHVGRRDRHRGTRDQAAPQRLRPSVDPRAARHARRPLREGSHRRIRDRHASGRRPRRGRCRHRLRHDGGAHQPESRPASRRSRPAPPHHRAGRPGRERGAQGPLPHHRPARQAEAPVQGDAGGFRVTAGPPVPSEGSRPRP